MKDSPTLDFSLCSVYNMSMNNVAAIEQRTREIHFVNDNCGLQIEVRNLLLARRMFLDSSSEEIFNVAVNTAFSEYGVCFYKDLNIKDDNVHDIYRVMCVNEVLEMVMKTAEQDHLRDIVWDINSYQNLKLVDVDYPFGMCDDIPNLGYAFYKGNIVFGIIEHSKMQVFAIQAGKRSLLESLEKPRFVPTSKKRRRKG